ncbi:MAG: hypothetical protein ABI867_41490 [Kofleriaceae bacterium]
MAAKPKKSKPKPAAAAVVFHDKNLQLALLDEVLQETDEDYEKIQRAYATFRKTTRAPTWETITSGEGFDHQPRFEKFMLARPIKAKQLAGITDLTLDGDRDLYAWIYPYWWDGGDHFEIHDLRDLAYCKALAELDLGQGLVGECSLAPLVALPKLRALSLCSSGNYSDLDALLAVKSLKELEVVNTTPAWRDVIDRLQDNGVTVKA